MKKIFSYPATRTVLPVRPQVLKLNVIPRTVWLWLSILCLAAGAFADDFTYTTNNGTITITSYTGPGGEVTIPSSVGGMPVTTIGSSAFANKANLTKVLLPDSVLVIGDSGFCACRSLTNIALGSGLIAIGNLAFSQDTALTNLVFPEALLSIGNFAFSSCASLSGIEIPTATTNIGIGPFSSCTSLAAIRVAPLNPHYISLDGVLFNYSKTILLESPAITASDYSIPAGVEYIADYAFSFAASLRNLSTPDTLKGVGEAAFSNCSSLTNVNLPAGVKNIGDWAFLSCGSLPQIAIPETVSSIGRFAFRNCGSLTTISVPNSVKAIAPSSFHSCSKLVNAELGSGITNIGVSAFSLCSSLTNISLPAGLIAVADEAFSSCGSLLSIAVPNMLTSIGANAFASCISLREVILPSSVHYVGVQAFASCKGLTNAVIGSGVTNIGSKTFYACPKLIQISVAGDNPAYSSLGGVLFNKSRSLLIQYSPALPQKTYVIPRDVTNVLDYAFYGAANLNSVTFPESLRDIGSYAFNECAGLARFFFLGNAPVVGTFIFPSFVSATVYYQAGTLGWTNPFAGRPAVLWDPGTQMTYVTNGSTLSVTGYVGPESKIIVPSIINGLPVTRIENSAFSNYIKPTEVTVPASVTSIANAAFKWSPGLTGVYFEGKPPTLGPSGDTFWYSDQVTIYYLPGTTGWTSTYGGRPTATWLPSIQTADAAFGVQSNQFGFNISWARDRTVVIDASASLDVPNWVPASTNTLVGGSAYFRDPDHASYPSRFYRVRSP